MRGVRPNHYGRIDEKERTRMVKLHNDGLTYTMIARIFGVAASTAAKIIKNEKAKQSGEK